MSLSCTISETLSLIYQNLKWSRDPEHSKFGDNYVTRMVIATFRLHITFKCQASSFSKIWRWTQNVKIWLILDGYCPSRSSAMSPFNRAHMTS